MVARRRPAEKTPAGRPNGHYYSGERAVEFVSSGCTVLDCVLGGGWPLGRIANIVGDKAVGKTLLAIEACANFAKAYPGGHIWYREAEAAFDVSYAEELGLPVDRVDFGPDGPETSWDTIEDIAEDVEACCAAAAKSGQPGLYIIDSLDAVSSRAELSREVGKGTYGQEKPKEMSRLFRKNIRALKAARILVIVVSQIRDRIGVTFGEKYTRTGGKALDFYASQILWLHHKGVLTTEARGMERVTAVRIRAKCKKNKLGPSFRECEFVLRFGYGTDDFEATVAFFREMKLLPRLGIRELKDAKAQTREINTFLRQCGKLDGDELQARRHAMASVVRQAWEELEDQFHPTQRKYG